MTKREESLTCEWCGEPMPPGRFGVPRKFCSTAHRREMDNWRRRVGSALARMVFEVPSLAKALTSARGSSEL